MMLTCWGARVGVAGMPAGWVIGGVGGSVSATGVVGAAGWVVGGVGVSGAAMGLDGPVVAWVVGAVGLWWDMSMSWESTVVSIDVPALSLDVPDLSLDIPALSLDVPALTGSSLAVMGLLRSAGPRVQPVVALGWSGFSWQSLVRLCRVESCSGATSG